ncbi:MAG: hypothetical protein PVF49_01805 [Anaerolineales bacterium]
MSDMGVGQAGQAAVLCACCPLQYARLASCISPSIRRSVARVKDTRVGPECELEAAVVLVFNHAGLGRVLIAETSFSLALVAVASTATNVALVALIASAIATRA